MNSVLIALLFFMTFNANCAKEYRRVARDSGAGQDQVKSTTDVSTTLSSATENEEIEEDVASAAVLISKISKEAQESSKSGSIKQSPKISLGKAYVCSKLLCTAGDKTTPICACNFNTGNVASFKNKCDLQKHNCRFDTDFKIILEDICPWEFAFRHSGRKTQFDYRDPKYYN